MANAIKMKLDMATIIGIKITTITTTTTTMTVEMKITTAKMAAIDIIYHSIDPHKNPKMT